MSKAHMEVLANDAAILDLSSRREARPGFWIISAPAELMPDNHCFEWQYRGELNLDALQQFCNATREAWNERAHRKGTEAAGESPARIPDPPRDGPGTGVEGGTDMAEEEDVPRPEVSLEEYLQSEVDRWRGYVIDVSSQVDDLTAEQRRAERRLAQAEAALGAIADG